MTTGGNLDNQKKRRWSSFAGPRSSSSGNSSKTDQSPAQPLPVNAVRLKLVQRISENRTSIIIGETGCGKSTRIPQFIQSAGLNGERIIAVTQPRRVAAISLATHLAYQQSYKLGDIVGYSVRFENVSSESTRIMFMTDGILLREAIHDKLLKRYNVIVLDEAHERSIHTDVLFAIVKQAQKDRDRLALLNPDARPLKVVIMSATMNVDQFSTYFNNAPVLYIEGRVHPIQLYYSSCTQSDYVHAALVALFQIHRNKTSQPPGTILVFLTGQEEIESMVRRIKELNHELGAEESKLDVLPLYAALNVQQQMRVFMPCNRNDRRRVVLATNVAETSVTLPNVEVVIDCGKVKSRVYDVSKQIDVLKVMPISKAQANQRTGRAGRDGPGSCYRLYTERDYDDYEVTALPEIERCSLTSVALDLLAIRKLNVDLHTFDFISKPSTKAIDQAISALLSLKAVHYVDKVTDNVTRRVLQLTDQGRIMAQFPVDPKFSRMVLIASEHGCLREVLIIVAMMSVDNREASMSAHSKFMDDYGDHFTMLNIFEAFCKCSIDSRNKWCQDNFIQQRNIVHASKVHSQLKELCVKTNLVMNTIDAPRDLVRQSLCYGLYMNSAQLDNGPDNRGYKYRVINCDMLAKVHPSSSLQGRNCSAVVFSELVMTSSLFMRDCTSVDPLWLQEARTSGNK